jgi:predicted aspartyl protease
LKLAGTLAVPAKSGSLISGHPHVEILVSSDGKSSKKYVALIDTGYSGFVSLPVIASSLLGLKAHTTARYILANGKISDPVPLAYGHACLEGDKFVEGLIAISENTSTIVGMDFLRRGGKALILASEGVVIINEFELMEILKKSVK